MFIGSNTLFSFPYHKVTLYLAALQEKGLSQVKGKVESKL